MTYSLYQVATSSWGPLLIPREIHMAFEFNEERLNVPDGFRNLLEGLTVEVLRVKPTNIPQFAAEYFKERLASRQEKGYDECLLGSQIDGFYRYEPNRPKTTKKLLDQKVQDSSNKAYDTSTQPNIKSPASSMNQDFAASKIQAGFHGYKVRQEIKAQNESAEKIQAAYRGYTCREDLRNQNEAASKIQAGLRGYQVRKGTKSKQKSGETTMSRIKFQNEDEAATKIQAEFRGYQVRKRIAGNVKTNDKKRPASESHGESLPQKLLTNAPEAATRIQAGFRGYQQRKELGRQNQASTKIQASYRGFRDRKDLKRNKEASVKIQAAYRGYHDRKELKTKHKASTTIQSGYRGYRVRKVKNSQSQAAVKIQARYRGYRVRKGLIHGGRDGAQSLTKYQNSLSIAHYDSRFSFSLPQEDVKFEGNLDSDSDTDIEKVVKKIEKKKHEMKENGKDDADGD